MNDEDNSTARYVELLTANEREILSYVYALTLNWHDTQEIMQRVRIRLWQQFDRYDESKPFGPWARAVAYYLVAEFRTERQRQREYFSEAVMELVSAAFDKTSEHVTERRDALLNCLERLSSDQRDLLRQCYTENRQIADVADSLGLNPGALRQSLFRIRGMLQRCIRRTLGAT